MRKKTLRKLKLVVSLAMTIVMFGGCGTGAPKESNTQTVVQEGETKSQEVKQEETNVSKYPDYLNLESFRPIVKDGEEITLKIVVQRESIANSDINENWFVKFVEEKLNINLDIEELSGDTAGERKSLMIAANELPDIYFDMCLKPDEIVQYGVEGEQLLPMSDYINEELTPNLYELLSENEAAKIENTAPDGKMYTTPIILANYPKFGTQRVFIDTKYMNAIGMEKAPETLDEFVDMLRAFKKLDPATMGVDEIWPMVSSWGQDRKFLKSAFGWLDGEMYDPTWDVEEGEVVVPVSQKKYGDYVTLLHNLYSEGLIHPDFYTIDKMAARGLYVEGVVPVVCDSAPYVSMPDRYQDFIAAVPLTSQWCEKPITQDIADYKLGCTFISADTEYPELCMRLLDYFYSDEGSVYRSYGCPAGSEDTMGMIGGFSLDPNGNIVFEDVLSGKYESDFDYAVNAIEISQAGNLPGNEVKTKLYAQKLVGVDNPKFSEMDPTNPDQHYRMLISEAQKDSLVPGLPTMYLSADESARKNDLRTVIANYVDAETAKFVVGQRPLDELDDFFNELNKMGLEEYVKMCKDAYADYNGPEK